MEIIKLNQTLIALSLSLYLLILSYVQIAKSSKDTLKAFIVFCKISDSPRSDVLNKAS